ncbi:hypothetical protein GCM10023191_001990 [Actinoallomurus oryzae]|uniref:Uncharacterized protein n=1 Tax=Actinoallomurus oryzae TaxID=502180 RepID=A0ABP8P8D9_9ACTN
MADEAFAVRVLGALHYGRTAVRQHGGVRVLEGSHQHPSDFVQTRPEVFRTGGTSKTVAD